MSVFKKLTAPLLIAGLACTSLSWAAEQPLDEVVAIVNDGIIMESELDQRTDLIRQQLAARETRLPPAEQLRSQVLDRMVMQQLQLQLADEQGLAITDSQLNTALQNIAAQNQMTLAQFRQALIDEGQSYPQAREQIRQELLLQQVQQRNVRQRIKVSDHEVEAFLDSEQGQSQSTPEYNLSLILISLPPQAEPKQIQQAEKQAQALYAQLQQGADFAELAVAHSNAQSALEGGALGWRAADELPAQIAQSASRLKAGQISKPLRTPLGFALVKLNDSRGKDVQLVDETRLRHILIKENEIRTDEQAQRLAERLYRQLEQGADFARIAQKYSDDTASGSDGGNLGWAQPGQMVPEFEKVFQTTPEGVIAKPFKSRFGWHILQVQERRTKDLTSELRERRARETLVKRKFNVELGNWLRELKAQAYIEIKD